MYAREARILSYRVSGSSASSFSWLLLVLMLLGTAAVAAAASPAASPTSTPDDDDCPTILGKDEWGGKQASNAARVNGSVPYVLIHHTATAPCLSRADCQSQLVAIQREHMKRKWDDIGYNFLVDEVGNIYEGRGWGIQGAHSPDYNAKSVGISLIGNFMNRKPNATTIVLVKELIGCGVSKGHISGNYKLLGHRQTRPTLCPGDELFREITHWPHWIPHP